jgi:ribosomal protein S10
MKHYNIILTSKNRQSLKNITLLLSKNIKLTLNSITKSHQTNKKRSFITILKSPHVNKTAQEQFEYRVFSKQLTFSTPKHQLLVLLKKVKNNLFPDVKIKIRFSIYKPLIKKTQEYVINPHNLKLGYFVRNKKQNQLTHKLKEKKDCTGEKHERPYKQIKKLIDRLEIPGKFI